MNQLELMQKKKMLYSSIYDITNETVFTGEEEDATRYADLMEKREGLFGQIAQLDEDLSGIGLCKEAEPILADIKKIIKDIIALDKSHEAEVSRIMTELKKSLKDLSAGKSINKSYAGVIPGGEGTLFDTKN